MSRTSPAQVTTSPIVPGTQLTQQVFTTSGFAAGDYVYQYSGGQVGYPFTAIDSTSVSFGPSWVYPNRLGTFTSYASYSTSTYKASLVSPAIAGALYTGATIAGNTTTTFFSVPASNFAVASCVNAAGNYVVMHYNASNLYYSTYDTSAGALVAGPVLVTSTRYNTSSNVSVAPMSDGGWIIATVVTGTLLWTYYRYNSSGTQTATGTIDTTAFSAADAGQEAGFQIFGFSSGGWFFGWQQFGSASSYNFRGSVFNSSNVLQGSTYTDGSVIAGAGGTIGGILLASNGTTVLVLQAANPGSGGFSNIWSYAFGSASSTPTTVGGNYSPNGYNTFGFKFFNSLVANTDSTFSFVYVNASLQVQFVRFTTAGVVSTNPVLSPIISVSGLGACSGYSLAEVGGNTGFFVAKSDGTFNYVVFSSGGGIASTTTMANGINNFGNSNSSNPNKNTYTVSNQKFQILYTPYQQTAYLISPYIATKSVTQYYDTNTTRFWNPGTGYYFLGVGVSAASANSIGTITTNGVAQLNSSYSSAGLNNTFDYTTPIIKGNKGSQTSLTVTLKGLE